MEDAAHGFGKADFVTTGVAFGSEVDVSFEVERGRVGWMWPLVVWVRVALGAGGGGSSNGCRVGGDVVPPAGGRLGAVSAVEEGEVLSGHLEVLGFERRRRF